ncbi:MULTISPECIES: hypothetical protein [Photobacterium]|uniref:Uncharacterized protein n=2 Tax=Photobacterium TaxID=657 RepID=Q6LI88_PHOPR|nr:MULTISPECIES: hypothetical protein [Photobacterium]PSU49161.1 hypothetical protein C9J12_09225 [Photobacterium frigidiphilum]CAG22992.1 hypothetical protein PBPRB1120 [Photobacterium profundum SS9]
MNSTDFDGVKRDISLTVNDIFVNFEEDNYRLPTMEEFRTIFSSHAEQYIGPVSELKVEGIGCHLDRHRRREQMLWTAANELEAEQRFLRSDC